MYKLKKTKLDNNLYKLAFDKKGELYLYMPLIKFKGIKVLKRTDKLAKVVNMSNLNIKYGNFIFALKGKDNLNDNSFMLKKNSLFESDYLKIVEDKNAIMKLYAINDNIKNKSYNLINYMGKNIIDERFNNLESRKMSNRLLLPHYFFTTRYNEKTMPSQVRSWSNSVYNYLKRDKSGIKYLDIYSSKLIKLFFNLKYIQRKKIWDTILLSGLKIKPNFSIIKDMNIMIKYTSSRSSWSFKNLSYYPSIILTFNWLLEQIKFSSTIRKIITGRKEGIISGFKIKKKNYIRKLDKIFTSKPLFKHTSFSLIIDIFVYNNKTNKLQKFENILSRRVLYKYMYSMYVNYSKKIKESLNRPRFFYLNLIEPKTFNYYSNIVKAYENILTFSYKWNYIYISLLILKWNFISKNNIQYLKNKYLFFKYNMFNNKHVVNNNSKNDSLYNDTLYMNDYNIIKKNYNNSLLTRKKQTEKNLINNNIEKIVLKRRRRVFIKNKNLSKFNDYSNSYINCIKVKNENLKDYKIYNINKEIFIYDKEYYNEEDLKSNKKSNKGIKSKYLKYKKYIQELERKSTTPVDLSKLTLWSKKGIKRENEKNEYKRGEKHFRHNKYSLDQFKRKIYYAKGKAKRKVAPKIWKQKLMSFFLFSRSQKRDTNANKKFFNLNNKIINKESNNKDNNRKNVFVTDKLKNKNIQSYSKNIGYKYSNHFNIQVNVKKGVGQEQINSYYENKKKSIEVISNINYFLPEKDNIDYMFESLSNKEKYLQYLNKLEDNNILNGLFGNFFLLNTKKDIYINSLNDKKFIFSKLKEIIYFKRYKFISNVNVKKGKNKNNLNILYSKNLNNYFINSKILWDKLDYSIIKILNNIFTFNKNQKLDIKLFSYKNIFNKINNFINNNNIWYIYLIKKEFYLVNRDVLLSKNIDILPTDNNTILPYNYKHDDNNQYNYKNLEYKSGTHTFNINMWSNYVINKRDLNLKDEIGYSQEIFKPYYKYMIPIFIYKSYKSFISQLGYVNSILYTKIFLESKFNWIKTSNITILNYIIVKTLLDLLHYNYRSLIKVKPKYYYLNKLRYYGTKAKRLNFNTWIASVKYIKRLRKTPRQFWLRYHKLLSFYYGRIIKNAELNTKRRVLLPFVFYFEDLFFNIYGKWVIIRLWPLKRYYLNSYILAERIMLVILAQGSSTSSILEYRQSARNLINILRWSQVNKAYNYYNENNYRWPTNLIEIMKENNNSHYLNYNTLEFFNSKLEKAYNLSTYPLYKAKLNNYLPSIKYNYIHAFNNNINKIKNWSIKNKFINKKGKINSIRYVYYWLRPLNSYLISMKNHLDITGIKFKLTGRPGVIRSNVRSFSKTYFYGNLLGPRHFNSKTLKKISLTNPILRGTIKSNIDYNFYTSKSNNGSITLKIWMSSLFSSDIHELLLYLLGIKNLYLELVNRYYLVSSKFSNLKNYYLYSKVNKPIWIRKIKKLKIRKKSKINLSKILQRKYTPYINEYKLKNNKINKYYSK